LTKLATVNYLYVALAGEGRVVRFSQDPETGELELAGEVATPGGPGPLAIDGAGQYLYVGRRTANILSAFKLERASGNTELVGEVVLPADPNYLATDNRGRFLFSAYYAAGACAVHRVGTDGPPELVEWIQTGTGAHCMQTDPSNRFALLSHVAEPNHINRIYQYRFDEESGRLSPCDPARLEPSAGAIGPRHFCFHPTLPVLYTSNEQGCSVTAYAFDTDRGTLAEIQTLSSLPSGWLGENTCAQIRMDGRGRFLFVGNRGHNSVASFTIDGGSGRLEATGHAAADAVPRPLNIDPADRFLYVAGLETGRVNCYAIDQNSGRLERGASYLVGATPMWIEPLAGAPADTTPTP
jgi:6-phosphogluconolactonase